jgi:protein N-lysine methyltransferase METTL21D
MADVTYNTSSFPALLRTLTSLLALSDHRHHCVAGPGAHEPVALGSGSLVLLAYKERDPGERELWDMMARETGVVLECVGKQAGAGGLPVEIWLGKKALTHLFTGHAKSQTAPRS